MSTALLARLFRSWACCVIAAAASAGHSAEPPPAGAPAGYQLVYQQDFSNPQALGEFAMTDPKAWRLGQGAHGPALELFGESKYTPLVRSPLNIAIIADKMFEDFLLTVDLLQTGKEYGHRDLCLFFGMTSPTNFYYVHLASAADEHAHNIFIVDGQPRVKIASKTTSGIQWGNNAWHHVKLQRITSTGAIDVYFDDLTTPIMHAENSKFKKGYIGFGSFDDTGMMDNIKIWAPRPPQQVKSSFFTRAGGG